MLRVGMGPGLQFSPAHSLMHAVLHSHASVELYVQGPARVARLGTQDYNFFQILDWQIICFGSTIVPSLAGLTFTLVWDLRDYIVFWFWSCLQMQANTSRWDFNLGLLVNNHTEPSASTFCHHMKQA